MTFWPKSCSVAPTILVVCLSWFQLAGSLEAQTYLYDYSYVSAGIGPLGAVLGDFNHDGRIDLATVNEDNTVSVMLGKGNAAFASPVSYPTSSSPFALITADLRNNGQFDLIALSMPNGIDEPGTLSVLLGNSNGTFQQHVDYAVGDYPTGVVAGDFNGDSKVDLAIANRFDNTISILFGNGDGTFQPEVSAAVAAEPTSISTGDFNGDGRSDLIVPCVGTGVVSVLLSNGAGLTRIDTVTNLLGNGTSLVVTGSFTRDGNLDAVITGPSLGQLYLLKGLGNGSFSAPVPLLRTQVGEIYNLIAVDLNQDSKTDLAFGSIAPDEFSVVFGNGLGEFSAAVTSPVVAIKSIALSDINGDGFADLVAAEEGLDSVAIVLGNGKGQFGVPKTVSLKGTPYFPDAALVADFNGDGTLDLAVAETNFPTGQVAVSLGKRSGGLAPPLISPLLSEAINNEDRMVQGDFNGDGKPDLILMDDYSTGFQVLLGNGDGTFKTPVDTKLNTTLNFAVGDFNEDGKTDVVVSTFSNGQSLISIYLSKGDGTFALGAQYTETFGGPIVADVNRDGKLDLVSVGNPVFVMLGNGDGTFRSGISGPIVISQSEAIIDDFDGDGVPDIVVATSNGLAFLKGNGDGTFQNPTYSVTSVLLCCGFQAGDVNGDGKLDLLNSSVLVLLGNGDGTFQLPFLYGINGQTFNGGSVIGDFNADGVDDIAMIFENTSSGTTSVSAYLSEPTVALSPTSINFTPTKVGQTSPPMSAQLADVGNKPLSISSISVSGNFTESNNCKGELGIGAACTIQIRFVPTTRGTQTGTVTIVDSSLGGTQRISLTGVGR